MQYLSRPLKRLRTTQRTFPQRCSLGVRFLQCFDTNQN